MTQLGRIPRVRRAQMSLARLLTFLVAALALFPAAASATSLSGTSTMTYAASSGEKDRIIVATSGTTVTFSPDPGSQADHAWSVSATGCTQAGASPFVVTCTTANTKPIT